MYEQIQKLAAYLSNIGVKSDLVLDRIGFVEAKQEIKYFMGLDFEWDQEGSEERLGEAYKEGLEIIYEQLYEENKEKKN